MKKGYITLISIIFIVYMSVTVSLLSLRTNLFLIPIFFSVYEFFWVYFAISLVAFTCVFAVLLYLSYNYIEYKLPDKLTELNIVFSAIKVVASVLLLFLSQTNPTDPLYFYIFLGVVEGLNWVSYYPKVDDFAVPTCQLIFFLPYLYSNVVSLFILIQYAVAVSTLFTDEDYRWLKMLGFELGFVIPFYLLYQPLYFPSLIVAFSYSALEGVPALVSTRDVKIKMMEYQDILTI